MKRSVMDYLYMSRNSACVNTVPWLLTQEQAEPPVTPNTIDFKQHNMPALLWRNTEYQTTVSSTNKINFQCWLHFATAWSAVSALHFTQKNHLRGVHCPLNISHLLLAPQWRSYTYRFMKKPVSLFQNTMSLKSAFPTQWQQHSPTIKI